MNRFHAYRICLLAALALGLAACGPQPPEPSVPAPKKVVTNAAGVPTDRVAITAGDQMKYSQTLFEVPAGENITLTFTNEGRLPREIMAHNLVILEQGRSPSDFMIEASFAGETDYIPEKFADWIVAHTKLLAAGDSDTITFPAPKEPGEYPFLCTFPGHAAAGMKGTMRVVIETEE